MESLHGPLSRHLPWAWSVVLAVLMLGPALGRGFVLSYDMVWVPDLDLRPSFVGLGSGLPRAVPSDAIVAVLDEVLPGMLLQKVLLVAVFVVAGAGAARLTDQGSLVAPLVSVTVYVWSPFMAERLVIGHWPVLVGYAVLPWVAHAARTWRATGRLPLRMWWLVPLGSLSASAGLATAVALVAFAVARQPRRLRTLALLLVAANAPWLVSGLLHATESVTSAQGASSFALQNEGSVPAPLAALTLGGIWNSEVVPGSRTGVLGWLSLAFVLALLVVGFRRWRTGIGPRDASAYLWCWAIGWGLAVLTWLAPATVGWLVGSIPGAGLVRDGSRLLSLSALAVASVAGYGASTLLRRLSPAARPGTVLVLLLAPLALMPDAAFGVSGLLRPADFPADYSSARAALQQARDEGATGDVVVLPMSSYRQPSWNHDHKVLDPLGRYQPLDYVAGDDLYVDGVLVEGEDRRARAAARALEAATPGARAARLSRLGIGFVATEKDAGPSPLVAASTLLDRPTLTVQQLRRPSERAAPRAWIVAMAGAWSLFVIPPLWAAATAVRRRTRRRGSK